MKTVSELKSLSQWVGYTSAKIPMNPHTGVAAASNNPDTWGTAAQAWSAKKRYGWAGIGYVFTIAAGVVGIDLDDCFDEAGQLSDMARQVMQMLDSYTERSPSGKGLHILACGSIPHSIKQPGFEMYNELRYFTVTGKRFGATSGDIEDKQTELTALFVTFGGDMEPARPVARPTTPATTEEKEVARALAVIPPRGDYNADWLPMLLAVHDAFPDARGIALIESWSPGYEGEVARKWRSFDRTARGGITIKTLFHRAMQFGYEPPKRQAARPTQRTSDITDELARRRNGHAF
mgnify:CR=1 FL=1